MMYNPQLETFLCVVDSGSFSKAAEKLYITPPAVIKQINALESSLELQLFERTHRGLVVTKAGQSLYRDAKYLIQYSKDSVNRAKEAMDIQEEIIRIGVSPMTPPQVFVTLWPKIQKLRPEMKLHHRLAVKETLTIEDLYGENLLLMQRGWSEYVDILRDELWENHPQIHVTDFEFYNVEVFNRCENSNDVLLAIKNWESVHPLMKIIPVEWSYSIPFGLLYSLEPSKKVKKLLSATRKAIEEM